MSYAPLLDNGKYYWTLGKAGADVVRAQLNKNPQASIADTLPKKRIEEVRAMKMSWTAIGETFGVSDKTVKRALYGRTN